MLGGMDRGSIEAAVRTRDARKPRAYALSLLTGIVGGLVVVGYRAAIAGLEILRERFAAVVPSGFAVPAWMAIAAAVGIVVFLLVKVAPLIAGSGIPQVKAALMRKLELDWTRELPSKFAGGALALGAGLSLGREGPSIQLGALVGAGCTDLARSPDLKRYLVTAGAAAGISAAFNAPLAGVLFCVEELHRSFSPVMLACAMIASVTANAVSWLLTGGGAVFGLDVGSILPLEFMPLVILAGAAAGLLGALFNAALTGTQRVMKTILPRSGTRMTLAFAFAGLVALTAPALAGGGQNLVEFAGRGAGPALVAALLAGKFAFTLISYGSGAPGGIFLPMLAIGALLGSLTGNAFESLGFADGFAANFAIIGMVGFFTAVVRAPITGAILVTEMSGSLGHFPALVLVALCASIVAGLLRSEPIYDTLVKPFLAAEPTVDRNDDAAVIHVTVHEGSVIDRSENAQTAMPDGCVLVGIRRGEHERLPRPGMDIQPGDVLEALVSERDAHAAKDRLRRLAGASEDSLESVP